MPPQNTTESIHRHSTFTTGAASDNSPNCAAVTGSAKTMDATVQLNAASIARRSHAGGVCRRRSFCSVRRQVKLR